MAKNEVATVDPKDVSQVPAYLQNTNTRNDDNFDSSDIVLPRIKLLQGTSEEIINFDAAKAGEFWHTGLDISLGSDFRFVVADRRKKILLMAPMQDGQGILARAEDAKTWDRLGEFKVKIKNVGTVEWKITDLDVDASGLTKWGTFNPKDENSPPAATRFYDYLVYLPDFPDLGMSVMSVARTAIKKAKKGLNDKIQMQGNNGRPMQSLIFSAKQVGDSADGQDFFNWQFTSAGFVQDEGLFRRMLEYRGALANVKVADEGGSDVNTSGGPTDTGEGSF